MAGEETERAVIAMAATGDGWSDERPAVAALERLAPIRLPDWFAGSELWVIAAVPAPRAVGPVEIAGRPLSFVHLRHVGILPCTQLRA